MNSILKKVKSNNKGDTLAIVLIGIVIVGVLGTVILKASSVNVGMKVSNLKGKQNFYYVERAIDDIYAGIGTDVSKAMQEAYDIAMKNVVKKSGSSYITDNALKTTFETKYMTALANYQGTKSGVLSYLAGFIDNTTVYNSLGVNITVEEAYDASGTSITDVLVVGKTITIKNVVVRSKSLTNKYESSVTTDFVIETPDINFNFKDTSDTNLDKLFKYAIIADGQVNQHKLEASENTEKGAVNLTGGTATVNGNIYAGEYHDYLAGAGTRWIDKDGIYVDNAVLNVNGANIVSKGAVNLGLSANVTMNGESSAANPNIDSYLPLRLWTKDIILSGNQANADINGDCFIKDDLEVNGNKGVVDISGSYYGFGFDGDINIANESSSGEMVNFEAGGAGTQEHEKRSAVIVNGKEANVKLTTDSATTKQFVLGGRAYIDLSNNVGAQTQSADYMTGESISIKGNQKIYLLDNPSSYQTTPTIVGNPMSKDDLGLPGSYTSDEFYNLLTLDRNRVVAKKVGESVYFYNRQDNPDLQTQYVVDSVRNTTKSYWDMLNEAVENMNIINLSLGSNTNSYTVGTAMQVVETGSGRGILTTGRGGTLAHHENGIDEPQFVNIVKNVKSRYETIMYNLDDDRDNPVGANKTYPTGTGSPYDYFINDTAYSSLVPSNRNERLLRPSGEPGNTTPAYTYPSGSPYTVQPISTTELEACGIDGHATVELVVCDNNNLFGAIPTTNTSIGTMYGVVICSGDVEVNCNFEGMIICGGDITINGNYTFTANPKLMKLLYDKSDYLKALIGGSTTSITPPTSGIMSTTDGKYAFDKFVRFENWKKNAD